MMILSLSFNKTIQDGILMSLFFILSLKTVKTSDDWITVTKVTPDPVFVTVGETLKLRLNIENPEGRNVTALWARTLDYGLSSHKELLQMIKYVGGSNEKYSSYNVSKISRERQIDLVLSDVVLADSGIYRCTFRSPPDGDWNIWKHYMVIIEEKDAEYQVDIPDTVYITKGATLKLESKLQDTAVNLSGGSYESFWDFSPRFTSNPEVAVRMVSSTERLVESLDPRLSLRDNGTTLMLRNTTLNDSGVYHLRIVEASSTSVIRKDFNVFVEDKPIASMRCPKVVHLIKGENFFCLCEDISKSEVVGQAFWLHEGKAIKHSRRFHEEELYLENVTKSDAGLYTCRIRSEASIVELSTQVFVSNSAEREIKHEKQTAEIPRWYLLAGAALAGFLLGGILLFMIQSVREKCRNKNKDVYVDVCGSNLEVDVTSQYQDMNDMNRSRYQEPASSSSHYEVADFPVYQDMSEASSVQNQVKPGLTLNPAYTELDLQRLRMDSHPYQELQLNSAPESGV